MAAIARFAPTAARVLLGLVFFVFGLNGVLGFLPQPEMNAPSAALMGAFVESGYLMTFIKVAEVLAGFLLLTNLFVPLALVVLAPITLNILAFHAVLAPPTVGMSIPSKVRSTTRHPVGRCGFASADLGLVARRRTRRRRRCGA